MTTAPEAYPIRDSTGEWGAFQSGTIAALAHVGKVTGEEEVCLPDGSWVPILSIPVLRQAITGEEGEGGGAAAPAPAPEAAAEGEPAAPVAEPAAAAGGAAAYEVIRTDGTMLGPFPLALAIAHIRDGTFTGDDLVAKDGGAWLAGKELAEFAGALSAGVRDGADDSTPSMPETAASPAGSTAAGEAAPAPPGATPATEAPAASALAPPGSPPPAAAFADAAAEPAAAPSAPTAPPPTHAGDLAATPMGPVLNLLLRARETGLLQLAGEPVLLIRFRDGHPLAGDLRGADPGITRTEALAALGAPADADERAVRQALSVRSVETVLSAFGRHRGSWRFDRREEDQDPQFWLHPWELQRAGLSHPSAAAGLEGATEGWAAGPLALPGAAALATMPLDDVERGALGLVDGQRTWTELLASATASDMPAEGVLKAIAIALNLGIAVVEDRAALGVAGLIASGKSPDDAIAALQAMDDATVLGLAPTATLREVKRAYVSLADLLKDYDAPAEVRSRILARVNEAHKRMVEAARTRVDAPPPPAAAADSGSAEAADDAGAGQAAAGGEGEGEGEGEGDGEDAPGTSSPVIQTVAKGGKTGLEALQERNYGQAREHIENGRYADAERILRQLVHVSPLDGRFHGALGYAGFFTRGKSKQAGKKALDELDQAIRLTPNEPDVHYFMGDVYRRIGDDRRAERAFQEVLKLSPTHEDALAELKGFSKKRRRRSAEGLTAEPKELFIALGLFAGVLGITFYIANVLGYDPSITVEGASRGFGEEEYYLYHDAWWFYGRRAILLIAGLIGIKYVLKDDVHPESHRPVEYTFLACLYGPIYGFLSFYVSGRRYPTEGNTGQVLVPMLEAVIPMVILGAITEEIFFRRFLGRALVRRIPTSLNAAFVGGLLYGLYHVTYVPFYWGLPYWDPEVPLYTMPAQVLMIAMTMGLPLCLLYLWSRSVVVSIIASSLFATVYTLLSIFSAMGKF